MEPRKPTAAQLAARERHAGEPYREELMLAGYLWALAALVGLLLVPPAWRGLFGVSAPPLWLGMPVAALIGFAFWNGYRRVDALVVVVFVTTAVAGLWRGFTGRAPWWLVAAVGLAAAVLAIGLSRSRGLAAFQRQRVAQRPQALGEVWVVVAVVAAALLAGAVWVAIGLRTF